MTPNPPRLQLHGIVVPFVTPYTADGAIDTASLRRAVTHLVEGRVQDLFALDSTDECVFLNPQQRSTMGESIVNEAAVPRAVVGDVIDTGRCGAQRQIGCACWWFGWATGAGGRLDRQSHRAGSRC
jgi:Dihydrodipicolinate synthetase family